jgi:hypothetical protein
VPGFETGTDATRLERVLIDAISSRESPWARARPDLQTYTAPA